MVVQFAGEAEIGDFEFAIVDEDIFRFYVSVDEVQVIEHFVPLAEISQKPPDEFLRAIPVLLNVLFECAPIAILHDQVEVALC